MDSEIGKFIKAIRDTLPNEAAKTDEIMRERGFESDKDTEHLWVEALADVTNMHIRRRNQRELKKQFQFFSTQFDRASDTVKNCMDTCYIENLMWNLKAVDKKWAWPQIPENLANRYIAMWGKPII